MKKIKKFLKKYKMLLMLEFMVAVVMVGNGTVMYKLTYEAEYQKVQTMYYNLGKLTNFDKESDKQISDFIKNIDDVLMYDFVKNNSENKYYGYGVTWEIYDKNNNVIEKSTDNDLMLTYCNLEQRVNKAYLVEKYFTKEEMEGAWDFIYSASNKNEFLNMSLVKEVTGYYGENDEFIPVEIVLFDDDSDQIYSLKSKENINKEGASYTTIKGRTFKEDNENYFSIENLKKRNDSVNGAIKKAQKGEEKSGIYYHEIELSWTDSEYDDVMIDEEQGKPVWVRVGLCADLNYMTLNNSMFKSYLIIEIVLCLLIGIGIIYVFKKNDDRRKYLDAMKYTFINAMAHEMKTPSAVIVNSVECINDGIKPEKQSKYLEKVKQEGLHMNRLLLDMLTYTKLTDEDRKIYKEEVNMKELFDEVIEHYSDAIEKKDIKVQWDISSKNTIMADRKLMEMVVDNYVSNAVKYCTESGSIKITINEKNIVVFNNGDTIYPTQLLAIWEPLYVIDGSRKNREGSSGMGLAISARIMDLHGMQYGAQNKEDGVEFYIKMA